MGKRARYEDTFKDDAVRLVREKGRSVADVARSLGMHVNTLHGWVNERGGAKRAHRSESDEAVRRLERELRRVTEERDILKKAVGFFASERK